MNRQHLTNQGIVYHVLPEGEPFSERYGGALSRWVANVVRGDRNSIVICPWADATWNLDPAHILELPALNRYRTWAKPLRYQMATGIRVLLLRRVFDALRCRLRAGDTVYLHNRPEFALALAPCCRRRTVKLVLHLQNSHLRHLPALYRSLLDLDALVFCSDYLRSEARAFAAKVKQSIVIPNGADEACFFPRAQEAPTGPQKAVILFVGRLVPEKGVHIFVEAMRLLEAHGVQASGRIIGSKTFGGHLTDDYVRRLKRNKPGNVEFGDYVWGSRLAEEFRSASIFCCPSTWNEPFGMVNVEAMATALPVVATRVGGVPEIFRNGGAVLVPGGSPPALAAALEMLVHNPQKRGELSKQGYQSYQVRYRWEHIRCQYFALMERLASEGSRGC
jgi:spore coat protein SA